MEYRRQYGRHSVLPEPWSLQMCSTRALLLYVLHRTLLVQAYYFVGRIAGAAMETLWWGHRYRAYEEAVPGGVDRGRLPFEDWCNTPGNEGNRLYRSFDARARL